MLLVSFRRLLYKLVGVSRHEESVSGIVCDVAYLELGNAIRCKLELISWRVAWGRAPRTYLGAALDSISEWSM